MIQTTTRIVLVFFCVILLACAGCKKGNEPAEAQKEGGAVVRQKVAVSTTDKDKAPAQDKTPAAQGKEAAPQEMKEKSPAAPTEVKAQKEAQEAGVEAPAEGAPGGVAPPQAAQEEVKVAETQAAREGQEKVAEAGAGPAKEELEPEATPKEAKEPVEAAPKRVEEGVESIVIEEEVVEPIMIEEEGVEPIVIEGGERPPSEAMKTAAVGHVEEKEQASAEEGGTGEEVSELPAEGAAVSETEGQESTEGEQIKIDLGELAKEKGTESAETEEGGSVFNPFMPLFKKESKANVALETTSAGKKRAFLTPLERIGLSQLRLTGIVMAPSGNRAIVEDSTGKGYVIRKGTYIGLNSGVVEKITDDRVIVVETIGGRKAVTELKLQKEAGE